MAWIKTAFQPRTSLVDDLAYTVVRVSGYVYATLISGAVFLAITAWQGSSLREVSVAVSRMRHNSKEIELQSDVIVRGYCK